MMDNNNNLALLSAEIVGKQKHQNQTYMYQNCSDCANVREHNH